jgi:NTP pyrophosphatase (non-canonical NTP hydrolase)
LQEVIFQALGAASVCWDENRVFDSERAKRIGDEVVDWIGEQIEGPFLSEGLALLGSSCMKNSERWFPAIHQPTAAVPLEAFMALGLGGEVGELLNFVKKGLRSGDALEKRDEIAAECADIFIYLLLFCNLASVDLIGETLRKITTNEARWGDLEQAPTAPTGTDLNLASARGMAQSFVAAQQPVGSGRPPRYGNCTCDCHVYDVSHVAPCCSPRDDDEGFLLS